MEEYSWSEYVDLISDSSIDLFPKNHGSAFTNKLIVPQDLPENCYVAATEFEYVNTVYNVKSNSSVLAIFDWTYLRPPYSETNPNSYPLYGKMILADIKEGWYDTHEKIVDLFNATVKSTGVSCLQNHTLLTYNPINMKFSFDSTGLPISVFIRGDFLNFLGIEYNQASKGQYVVLGRPNQSSTFEETVPDGKGGTKQEVRHVYNPQETWKVNEEHGEKGEFKHAAQLRIISSFIIYIDIIESQKMGDSFADAIRVIPINKSEQGLTIISQFEKPYYLKLNKRHIETIRVEIRSLDGELMKFLVGRTRLKLHFMVKP